MKLHLQRSGARNKHTFRAVLRALLAFSWALASTSNAYADVALTTTGFNYTAGQLPYLHAATPAGGVFAAWNATSRDAEGELLKPGMKILFWGAGKDCRKDASYGPVNGRPDMLRNAPALTGIALDPTTTNRWSPSGDAAECSPTVHRESGPAFVHVNETPGSGGIGLFTHTGRQPGGSPAFWGPYGAEGQPGLSTNRSLEGTFVTFRFDWRGQAPVRPWSTETDRLTVRTEQALASIKFPPGDVYNVSGSQLHQHFGATLVNIPCMEQRQADSVCLIKFLFSGAVLRPGIRDWQHEKGFDVAGMMFDRAQRGLPVVFGPLKSAGGVTAARGHPDLDLWSSIGNPSQHSTFGFAKFGATISFSQLRNALAYVALRAAGPERNTQNLAADIGKLYGPRWNDPSAWALVDTHFAQEVHGKGSGEEVYMGGGLKEVYAGRNLPP